MKLPAYLAVFITVSLTATAGSALGTLPPTTARPVTEIYFGKKIVDPYRWLENTSKPEVQTWLKEQDDYTRGQLARLPGRNYLYQQISALSQSRTVLPKVERAGDRYFYLKTSPGANVGQLYVRAVDGGKEKLLIDPQSLAEGTKIYTIDYFYPSPNGQYLAYGLSSNGSEQSVLHVIAVETGTEVTPTLDRMQYPALSWLPDSTGFFYARPPKLATGARPEELYRRDRVYLRLLNSSSSDVAVFGYGILDQREPDQYHAVLTSPASPYVLALITHGVSAELTIYAAPLQALREATPTTLAQGTLWRKIADPKDAVVQADLWGEEVFLLSHQGAPRYQLLRTLVNNPQLNRAQVVIPQSQAIVDSFGVAQDALYVKVQEGGIHRLLRVAHGNGQPEVVPLPYQGNVRTLKTAANLPGTFLRLEGWTQLPLWYSYDPQTRRVEDTQLLLPAALDLRGYVAYQVLATSRDGTKVPLSIIHKDGLLRDGRHPTLLRTYGAYGYSINPAFQPALLPWLERGGVVALAHVRGGGEYGEAWHQAGMKNNKMNSIYDFLGCARYLIAQGYTSSRRLVGEGGSAGAITVGRASTEQPNLFAAILLRNGSANPLRQELTAIGPANITEFGSFKTKEGFEGLTAMDPYLHVTPRRAYPAYLLTAGINDSRVPPWQPAKMTARLQANTMSDRPVLLRVDYQGGHGLSESKNQENQEWADMLSFLLWQVGEPDFQPGGK